MLVDQESTNPTYTLVVYAFLSALQCAIMQVNFNDTIQTQLSDNPKFGMH